MSNRIEIVGAIEGSNEIYARDRGRIIGTGGVCYTLTARDYKDPPKVIVEVKHGQGNTSWKYFEFD